jgi:hypothetical protein
MEILGYAAAYLALCFCICSAIGRGIKNTRAMSLGISLEEDTRRQDEAQLEYIRSGKSINVCEKSK